jgi:hypothetical protein
MRLRSLLLLGALTACNGLLGLDEAHLDPTLGAGGDAASGAAGAGAGSEAGTPCERYCQAVTDACTGDNAQYTDLEACLLTCPQFPEGSPEDTEGNTLACRLNYALKAPTEPITYCTWAGPGGDGVCGTNCEGFCTLMAATCTAGSTRAETDFFPSTEACRDACAEVPQSGPYSATNEATTGGADLFECRLYHVAAAIYADDAAVHCPHAMGLELCVDR